MAIFARFLANLSLGVAPFIVIKLDRDTLTMIVAPVGTFLKGYAVSRDFHNIIAMTSSRPGGVTRYRKCI